MKILILANHFLTLYSFRKELIARLISDNHQVYLSLPDSVDNVYFAELGCSIISTSIDRRGVNPVKDFKLIKQYEKMMKNIRPDIVFSYTIKPNIYGSLVTNKLQIKQICNITGTGATFLKNNVLSFICKLLYKLTVKKTYKAFFQNIGDKDFFVKNKMISDNYELLPGSGCNLTEYEYSPALESNKTTFLFIGRVMKLKGVDEYLECARIVKNAFPSTEFLIAGWNEEEKYKKIVGNYEERGIVKYIGFQKNIKEWIKDSSCTILPSHGGEGVPNVLLESAAIGRPCIGSNIAGTNEVIDDGVSGFLFEPKNVEDMVKCVERFLSLTFKERLIMGKKARERIETLFDRKIVIERYLNELK